MALIKSISGIRGTIGGKAGLGLTPLDIVKFTSAYGMWVKKQTKHTNKIKVVLGRDARISGEMVEQIAIGTLAGMGIDVINIGLATTPTVEIAVPLEKADGGIILTASHNPKQWNALKLLNNKGEFLSAEDGKYILEIAEKETFDYAEIDMLGDISRKDYIDRHIEEVKKLKLIDIDAIKKADFTVAVDAVNSVGGIAIPKLLKAIGVNKVVELNCNPNGKFPHNPEPLPENLTEISKVVKEGEADLGFVVDPDVDRLAVINEDGTMFGEEYTLVSIADYILEHTPGNTCSNLSSTRALREITKKHNQQYFAAAVGEVNVVAKMKEKNVVIGGEGNGGVIYPEAHYGRDALVGVALFLTLLAKKGKRCSELRKEYPQFYMSKNKIQLSPSVDVDVILEKMKEKYSAVEKTQITTIDGVKIDFPEEWVHLRKSNTEPIIRIYSESSTTEKADKLAEKIMSEIKEIC